MDKILTEEKEKLFESHRGLILSIAKRFSGRGVGMDELFQIGCVGFLKAAEGFDKNFGTKFSTYAVPFIVGEIKKFFRDDGQVKVSRSVKSLYFKICSVREGYVKKHGSEPQISEIADELGIDRESVTQALLSQSQVFSIYDESGKINDSVLMAADEPAEDICDKISIHQAIKRLPPHLMFVVEKRYFMHMTQSSVAEALDTSQVQVSRFEKKALELLRSFLEGEI